jgi:signal transduction histidine kinase
VLPEKFQLIVFRIISELLNNVNKHAKATEASAQVIAIETGIQVIIEDNGQGFAGKPSGGIGLINLQNRVSMCMGNLNIDTGDKGTIIIVELPIPVNL